MKNQILYCVGVVILFTALTFYVTIILPVAWLADVVFPDNKFSKYMSLSGYHGYY